MKSQTSQRVYFGTVADIAYYRVAKRLHVYTNLVLPSGFKLQLYQRKAISPFDSAVMCYKNLPPSSTGEELTYSLRSVSHDCTVP